MIRASLALPILVAAFAIAPAAHAQQPTPAEPPPSTIELTAPTGWVLDTGRTAGQIKTLRSSSHLGDQGVRASAGFYRSSPPGAVLVVSELVAEPAPADAAGAARAELAALRSVVEAVGGALVTWRFQGGEPTLPEARLEWTDPSVGTTSISRALVFRTAGALTVVTAECVLAGDAQAMRAPCEAALAAMRPLPSLARVEVGMGAGDPAEAQARADREPPPTDPSAPATGTSSTRGPTLREHTGDLPTTILVRPPAKTTDRRPLYLLAGVAVLALVFFWNRRQRARLDELEARERRRAERRTGGDGHDGDDGAAGRERAPADEQVRADADDSARADDSGADVDDARSADEESRPPSADDEARDAERTAREHDDAPADGDGGKPGGGKEGA